MAEMEFTDDNFDEEVLRSDLPVLVDFFAEWCGPCKMLAPIIDELAGEYEGKVKIGKCDLDASPDIASKYGVQSIPTLIFFKGGEVVEKLMGFQSKEALKAKLDEL
jgi:thioredoxin 1